MTSAARLSLGGAPARLSMEALFPVWKIRDVTADLDARFFVPVPKGDQVAKSSACIVGGQGSGKSVLLAWRAQKAREIYGAENVHTIHTDDIRVALDLIDDTPVQHIIIDDAMTYASSRQVFEQTEIVKTYNRSRHVFEEKLRGSPGLLLYDWAWQRFGELDPAFRQGDVFIFKTGMAGANERRTIEQFLGPYCTRYLYETVWDRISRGGAAGNRMMSVSVGCVASMDPLRGAGVYRSGIADEPLPPIIAHDEHFSNEAAEEDILNEYREKPPWDRRIPCYELSLTGLKQTEIAARLGVRQGYVSESIRKVRELLSKR